MSRCFPYKGGVGRTGPIREAPIDEPIKLQKERLRIHGTEKRSQSKRKGDHDVTPCKPMDGVRGRTIRFVNKGSEAKKLSSGDVGDGKKETSCSMRFSKLMEDSCESVMSEEHGQPISPTSLCTLSKASQNEQGKDASLPLVEKRGSVIRIRLSRKQPAVETPRTESPAELVTSRNLDSRRTDGLSEIASTSSREPVGGPFHSKPAVLEAELQYESLLDQWVPPPLVLESDVSDDLDWLLGTKLSSSDERSSKRLKTQVEVNLSHDSCPASSWPPRARYLPEADIHALPYTVLL